MGSHRTFQHVRAQAEQVTHQLTLGYNTSPMRVDIDRITCRRRFEEQTTKDRPVPHGAPRRAFRSTQTTIMVASMMDIDYSRPQQCYTAPRRQLGAPTIQRHVNIRGISSAVPQVSSPMGEMPLSSRTSDALTFIFSGDGD